MISPRSILLKLPAILIMAVITVLSSQSSIEVIPVFFGVDKIMHFCAFGALAFAFGLWFSRESWLKLPLRNFLICAAAASAFGIFDELHQYFVPGRSSDFWDWVFDVLGAAAGSAAVLWGSRKLGAGRNAASAK